MEKYVCSLELAKELKELGIKQESEFYWIWNTVLKKGEGLNFRKQTRSYKDFGDVKSRGCIKYYSAFTVGELGEKLPDWCASFNHKQSEKIRKWRCEADSEQICLTIQFADTEANARAKMLIYLLENKLINPQEVEDKDYGR